MPELILIDSADNFEFKIKKEDKARLDEMSIDELKVLSNRAKSECELDRIKKDIKKNNSRVVVLLRTVAILSLFSREEASGNLNNKITDFFISECNLIDAYHKAKSIIESKEVELWKLGVTLSNDCLIQEDEQMGERVLFVCKLIDMINKEIARYADERLANI